MNNPGERSGAHAPVDLAEQRQREAGRVPELGDDVVLALLFVQYTTCEDLLALSQPEKGKHTRVNKSAVVALKPPHVITQQLHRKPFTNKY